MTDIEYIKIGQIAGPHGLDGMLKISVISDRDDRFTPGNEIFIYENNRYCTYRISYFSWHKARIALIGLEGVDNRDRSELLVSAEVFITRDMAEATRDQLDTNEFYYYDLIGLDVYHNNELFGKVDSVMEGGAGSIIVISALDGKEVMIPFVDTMVDTSRVDKKRIDITPLEGLLEV